MIKTRKKSKDSEVLKNVIKAVHWDTGSKDPEYLEIRSKILYKSSRLALINLFCWFTSFVAFAAVAALHYDFVFHRRQSRPSESQLDGLVCMTALPYVTGPLGFWGAYQRQHINVFLYSYLVYTVSVVELSFGTVLLTFSGEAIREDILPDVLNEEEDKGFIHAVQKKLHCCGANVPTEWVQSKWWKKKREKKSDKVIPESCCRFNELSGKHMIGCNNGSEPYLIVDDGNKIYQVGCQKLVVARLNYFLLLCGGLTFSVGLVQFASFFAEHVLVSQLLHLDRESVQILRKTRRFSRSPIHHDDLDRLHQQSVNGSLIEIVGEQSSEEGDLVIE